MSRALLASVALGCKAETLGVDLPKGGPDAIAQEDLQRDLWRLADGGEPARSHLEGRLRDMHTLPAFGESYRSGALVCGVKDGRSGKGVLIAAVSEGSGALAGAVPAAALISLAKAWDLPRPPEHTLVFCWLDSEQALDAYAAQPAMPLDTTLVVWTLGPLYTEALAASPRPPVGSAPRTHLATPVPDWAGTADDRMERLDFRVLAERVKQVYDRVAAP